MKKSIIIILALLVIIAGCSVSQENIQQEQSNKPSQSEEQSSSTKKSIASDELVDWQKYMVPVKSNEEMIDFVGEIDEEEEKELHGLAISYCENQLKEDAKYMQPASNEDYQKFNFIERTEYTPGRVVMYKVQKEDAPARYIIFGRKGEWESLDDVLKRENVFHEEINGNSEEVIKSLKEEVKKYYETRFDSKIKYIGLKTNNKHEVTFYVKLEKDELRQISYSLENDKWKVSNEGY